MGYGGGMKVVMDIQAGVGQGAGIGRYVRELVRHARVGMEDGDGLTGFYFDFKGAGWRGAAEGVRLKGCRWMPGRLAQAAWKRLHWPPFEWFAGAGDVYHFPNFVIPPMGRRTKGKRVATIHDVSFLRLPETTEERNLAWLRAEIGRTAGEADAVLTDSRFSAEEIHETLGVERERIFPVWLGLDGFAGTEGGEDGADAAGRAARKELGLERPYLLMVGTLEPRKNLPFLVRVFEELRDWDGELVLVGRKGWKTEALERVLETSPRRERIRHLEGLGDGALRAVYGGAALFVYPTLYEGFGFPPLEAMARGVPVLSARNSSLPEVLGDAAEWVEGFDAAEWAEAVRRLLGDGARRAALRAAGRVQAGKFTWGETVRRTWEVYRRVSGGGS